MAHANRSSITFGNSRSQVVSVSEKRVISWLENNKSQLLTISGILLFIIVCSISFVAYQRYWRATALEDLRVGVNELQNGDIESAVERLRTAEGLLGVGKTGGKVATFYLNEAYNRSDNAGQKKIKDSVKDSVIESYSRDPRDYLSQILLLSQGRLAEKGKDFATARKFYEDASSVEGPFSAEALLGAARTAELANDLNAATAFREKFVATYPNSPFTEIVRSELGK